MSLKSVIMSSRRASRRLEDLFCEAYPLAGRAADVRSANLIGVFRDITLDREDLKQEVLIGIWAALSRFDPTRASLRTFVERVAATAIASSFRRTRAFKRTKPADYDPPAESLQLVVRVEYRVDLERVLGKLRLRDRKVAWLLVEYGPAQIARHLKISRPAVYRSIGRIRATLQESGFGR